MQGEGEQVEDRDIYLNMYLNHKFMNNFNSKLHIGIPYDMNYRV